MKRILIFLAFAFGLTWLSAFALMAAGGLQHPAAGLVLALVMLFPAAAVFLTRWLTKEGFRDLWLKPNVRGHVWVYVMAWFGVPVLIAAGAALYFLLFPAHFDPAMADYAASLQEMGAPMSPVLLAVLQIVQGLLLAPVLNFIFALGEELGWRGYLLPKLLERHNPAAAALITGVVWGVWHAPLIAMGHNYGLAYAGAPWGGIAAMVLFCVAVGGLFAWLSVKTQSCIPAAIAHGALNGTAAMSVFFIAGTPSPFVGPLPVGILGGAGLLLAGLASLILLRQRRT